MRPSPARKACAPRLSGGVPLDNGELALDVALEAFPLAVLNAAAPGQNLGGNLSGSGQGDRQARRSRLHRSSCAPPASGQRPLEAAGVAPLDVAAAGSYGGRVLDLSSATVNGPQGLTVSASGRVPLAGDGIGVTINGEAPLSLANRFLAERGAQVSGTLRLNANVSGSI